MNLAIRPFALLSVALVALVLAGCGSTRLWPFGDTEGRPGAPENAVRYQCNGAKSFYLRTLAGGDAWVILPEREFRLPKVAESSGRRFTNGVAVLDLGADAAAAATLNDGPAIAFAGCKTVEPPR